MDEQNSGAAPFEIPSPLAHKDRSMGLTFFGILTMMLGVLAALIVVVSILGQVAAARVRPGAEAPLWTMIFTVGMYGTLAVALLWLGIGSIKARRWARALLLIFSWSWLVTGVCLLGFVVIFLPKLLALAASSSGQQAIPKETLILFISEALIGFCFVFMPGLWVFFYSSKHVKGTCEARDSVERWTDACPVPVLGLCAWLALTVPLMLVMPLTGHTVLPFFGTFVTGFLGTLFSILIIGVLVYATVSLYRLEQRGWWIILVSLCLMVVSAVLTYMRHDFIEIYKLMGYPQAQIQQLQSLNLFNGRGMAVLTGLSSLPMLCYLLWVRKFMNRE